MNVHTHAPTLQRNTRVPNSLLFPFLFYLNLPPTMQVPMQPKTMRGVAILTDQNRTIPTAIPSIPPQHILNKPR